MSIFIGIVSCVYAEQFRVASYNVENLFDATHQGSEYRDYIPNTTHGWNEAMLEKKLANIAEVICDMNPEIIGLQEVENDTVLAQLQSKLKVVGCHYPYRAITTKKNAPIQIALLSSYPIVSKNEIVISPNERVRNILEVEVMVSGYPLRIFVNHWKSKADGAKESRRIGFAKALAKRIENLKNKSEYIIIGDLNTPYDIHRTLEAKYDDTNGQSGLGDVLQTAKHGALVNEDILLSNKQHGLHYNLWNEVPLGDRWSHQFYGDKKTLDHILIPNNMIDGKGIDYVNDSFEVFKPPYLFGRYGGIARWEYKYGKHLGNGYSDHLPLVATFSVKPYVPNQNNKVEIQKEKTIDDFYRNDEVSGDILLRDVVVVFKRGGNMLLKQQSSSRGIYGYQLPKSLQEGYLYDMVVHENKSYHGLKEITHITILKEKGSVDLTPFYTQKNLRQNEIFRNVEGVYRNRTLISRYGTMPIFFKNNITPPQNGSKIRLFFGHLGYHKKLQWVVYDPKDFEIME